ncbi:MAG: YraN family protein [Rhodospirillaceae bacterium]|nr:YraN family protein [Rhodospirillaceae bacterium]
MAAWFLRLKGFRVVARDLRLPGGEIDLVLRRGRLLVLVEIKARTGADRIEEAIGERQWRRIAAAAEQFCARRPAYAALDRRFDAVFLARGRWPRHLADAWRP